MGFYSDLLKTYIFPLALYPKNKVSSIIYTKLNGILTEVSSIYFYSISFLKRLITDIVPSSEILIDLKLSNILIKEILP